MMLIGDLPQSYPSYRDIAGSADFCQEPLDLALERGAFNYLSTTKKSMKARPFKRLLSGQLHLE
jgi:hypothetical protein